MTSGKLAFIESLMMDGLNDCDLFLVIKSKDQDKMAILQFVEGGMRGTDPTDLLKLINPTFYERAMKIIRSSPKSCISMQELMELVKEDLLKKPLFLN